MRDALAPGDLMTPSERSGVRWGIHHALANPSKVIAAAVEAGWRPSDDDLRAMAPSPESLGLGRTDPERTYLDGHDEVWIGSTWDIGRRRLGDRDLFDVYRKGNYWCHVRSMALALLIVADNEGFPRPEEAGDE